VPYISVVVKGDKFTAAREAASRDIPAAFVREVHGLNHSTVLRVSESFREPVASWFAETPPIIVGEGFPAGTCLIFSTHEGN